TGHVLFLRRSAGRFSKKQKWQVEAIWHDKAGNRRRVPAWPGEAISRCHLCRHRGHAAQTEGSSRLAGASCESGSRETEAATLDNTAWTAGHQHLSAYGYQARSHVAARPKAPDKYCGRREGWHQEEKIRRCHNCQFYPFRRRRSLAACCP